MDQYSVIWKPSAVLAIMLIATCVLQVYASTCETIDSCTCEMSDGSGKVNLRSLGKDSELTNYDYAFNVSNDGWKYEYNPCYGFYSSGFSDLAIIQTEELYGFAYDLGIQSNSYFNLTESSGLSIHYTAFDTLRTSRVLLICEPGTNMHNFDFVGELIITEYDFILTTPCACPGSCDDNGIVGATTSTTTSTSTSTSKTTTAKQPSSNHQVIIQVDIHHSDSSDSGSDSWLWTDVGGTMIALIFHDLILILVIAAVVIIIWNTPWCKCLQWGGSSAKSSGNPFVNLSSTNASNHNV